MMTKRHLPHLDALRALAVTIVVLFHLKVPGFNAGYLGVDLFFMLSGFLMTWTMLSDRIRHGRFRVRAFYFRRLQRIVPSLGLTILVTLASAYLIMSPEHLLDTAKQAQASLFFYSNIFFYNQAGYFAPESEVSALLHTWSLSVEEQFYLLFGLVLLLGNYIRFGILLAVLLVFGLLLMAIGYIAMVSPTQAIMPFGSTDKANDAVFFLSPYRVVLFAAGSACGWAMWHDLTPRGRYFPIVAIIVAVGAFISTSIFPLLEAWSAALILLPFSAMLFSNPIMDKIGELLPVRWVARISYQIYLVHWPLIVFWRYWTFRELSTLDVLAVGILSLTGGWALERFVSFPPFTSKKYGPMVKAIGATFFACVSLQMLAQATNGALFRIPLERQSPSSSQMREKESAYCGGSHRQGDLELGAAPGSPIVTCTRVAGDKHIYIWGDSHARQLLPGIAEAFPAATIDVLYFTSCLPQSGIGEYIYNYEGRKAFADACVDRNRKALSMFEEMQPTTIILNQFIGYDGDSSTDFLDASRILIEKLEIFGHKVSWIGAVPYPDRLLADCLSMPAIYSDELITQRCTGSEVAFIEVAKQNSVRASLFSDVYIDIIPQFCPDASYLSCVWIANKRPVFRDKHHLTVDTSIAFIRAIQSHIAVVGDDTGRNP